MHKSTNSLEKLSVTLINTVLVLILSIPDYLIFGFNDYYKLIVVLWFLACNLTYILVSKNRCVGMILLNIYWKRNYSTKQQLIYAVLYTLSFATAFIWVFFPFDLLLINLFLVQLPFVLKTGSTLHGYLSGKMSGYRKTKK